MDRKLKVLIVEDQKSIRDCLAFFTMQLGHEAIEADSVRKAIVHLERVDVVVLDMQLPDGNGEEILRHIEEDDYPVPVVIVSGHDEFKFSAERKNVICWLQKPFGMKQFKDALSLANEAVCQLREMKANSLALDTVIEGFKLVKKAVKPKEKLG